MTANQIISKYIPMLIPECEFYYEFIPEEANYPAMAYITGEEKMLTDLDGRIYSHSVDVAFGIASENYDQIKVINEKILLLVGIKKLPGIQLIELINKGDSEFSTDMTKLIGNEINMRLHMGNK